MENMQKFAKGCVGKPRANNTPRPMCRGLESSHQTHNTKGRLNLDKSRGFPVAEPVWCEIA